MTPILTVAMFGARWYGLLTDAQNAVNAERVGSLARLVAEQEQTDMWRAWRAVHALIAGQSLTEMDTARLARVDLSRLACDGCEVCRAEAVAA